MNIQGSIYRRYVTAVFRGNGTVNELARLGPTCPFIGLELASAISAELPRSMSGTGRSPQKLLGTLTGLKHAKVFLQGLSDRRSKDL